MAGLSEGAGQGPHGDRGCSPPSGVGASQARQQRSPSPPQPGHRGECKGEASGVSGPQLES